jgi:hypothetical protein
LKDYPKLSPLNESKTCKTLAKKILPSSCLIFRDKRGAILGHKTMIRFLFYRYLKERAIKKTIRPRNIEESSILGRSNNENVHFYVLQYSPQKTSRSEILYGLSSIPPVTKDAPARRHLLVGLSFDCVGRALRPKSSQ